MLSERGNMKAIAILILIYDIFDVFKLKVKKAII